PPNSLEFPTLIFDFQERNSTVGGPEAHVEGVAGCGGRQHPEPNVLIGLRFVGSAAVHKVAPHASGTCSKFPRTGNVRPRTSAVLRYLKNHPGEMARVQDPLLHDVAPMQPVASARHQMHITGH